MAKHYIAGLLKHAREITAVTSQWVNSYKRLVPGYEAPVYISWARRNRSTLVRVPMYKPGKEKATRIEYRSPDPSCNPYLTFAVMLAAGLEGIEKNIPCRRRWKRTFTPCRRKSGKRKRFTTCLVALSRPSRKWKKPGCPGRPGRAYIQEIHREQAGGMGSLPDARLPV